MSQAYGVHSEVGELRKVLVCAPGLAHRRLTPTNADDLLFDDVMWVENAQRDHADFVASLRSNGVDVVELHDLLAQTMAFPRAKTWLLDRKITANEVGLGLIDGTREFLESLDPRTLAEYLIGGLATSDLPDDYRTGYVALARESTGVREYLMPPLPNTIYTRDTTCWLYGGCTLNPLYWPARHDETLLMKAIYKFHPDFEEAKVWWGDPEQEWGQSTFEGGDIMPVGNGVVLMGMSERTSRQAITRLLNMACHPSERRRPTRRARRDRSFQGETAWRTGSRDRSRPRSAAHSPSWRTRARWLAARGNTSARSRLRRAV